MILIAGPCVIETLDILKQTVEGILQSIHDTNINFYFKASIQKDNRTKTENYRGMDFQKGMTLLNRIQDEYKVKICTDFHSVQQIETFGKNVDLIQIPAFLARQVSLLEMAGKVITNKSITNCFNKHIKIHIKKPQFMNPANIHIPIEILKNQGVKDQDIIISDRGTCFGYDQLIMDPRHIRIMKKLYPFVSVLADITHPNKNYSSLVSNSNLVQTLGFSSLVSGANGLFLETHINPTNSMCDKDTMISISEFKKLIKQLHYLYLII